MTFELQLLIVSAIFCIVLLFLLIVQKKGYLKYKIITLFMVLASVGLLGGASFFCYSEYASYIKRIEQYAKKDSHLSENSIDTSNNTEMVDAFEYFQEYRNSLNGYEFFLLDMSQNSDEEALSYQNALQDKIISQFQNEEYTQDYWNKAFNITFQYNDSTKSYLKSNYDIVYFIPKDYEYRLLDEEYGDLNNPKNLSYFENLCNVMYLESKMKEASFRSSSYIKTFWQTNKAFIYTFFSKTKYDQLCKKVVDDLITVYDEISKQPNYKTFYEEYDISDEVFLDFPSKKFTSSFEYSWPFSFWDRRVTENNSEQVYSILKEVQQHYNTNYYSK